ncbi:hypothetical protein EBR21_12100, partial [bacterium]|nr:hypothetical protein [bacterium]
MLQTNAVYFAPGDILTWMPLLNDFNPARVGFTLSVFDGRLDSAETNGIPDSTKFVPVAFNVAAVNDAPVLLGFSGIGIDKNGVTAKEDVPVELSFQQLYFAASKSDADDEVLASPDPMKPFKHRFVVESVSPGSVLLVDGNANPVGAEITSSSSIVWTPPLNASGSLAAFTLRLKDDKGADSLLSAANATVTIQLQAVNDPPVLAIPANEPVANYRLSGAQEDIPFVLTYDAIKAKLVLANNYVSDVDGPQLEFLVSPVAAPGGGSTLGVLSKAGNVAALGQSLLVQPGDSLVWQPPLNTNGVLSAFSVRVFDGALPSLASAQMEVTVQAVNHPPTIVTGASLVAQKNTALTINHLALAQLLNLADVENVQHSGNPATSCPAAPNVNFRIMEVPGGTITKINSSGSTVPLAPGGDIAPCEKLVWLPPLDALGVLPGVRFRAVDDQGLMSPTTSLVTFDVKGANSAPYFSGNIPATLQNGKQDLPYTVNYQALLESTGAMDAENNPIRFEVSAGLNGSTAYKGTTLIGPTPVLVGPGETVLWNPPPKVYGVQQAFEVRAFDGDKYSADNPDTGRLGKVVVSINLGQVNRAPSIATTPVLAGTATDIALEDTPYDITVEMLQAATQATDPDLNPVIRFKWNSAFTGSGTLQYESVPGTWQPVSAGQGDILGAGYSTKWRWTPPLHNHGPLKAFAIQAFDGDVATGLNPVAVPVTVNVNAVNDKPVLGSLVSGMPTIQTLNGGLEDQAYLVRYDALMEAGVPSDVDGDLLRFKFISAGVGTLFRNGNPVA